jgi:hypothetical protein
VDLDLGFDRVISLSFSFSTSYAGIMIQVALAGVFFSHLFIRGRFRASDFVSSLASFAAS